MLPIQPCAERRRHQLDDHAARCALRIRREVHHQQVFGCDRHPFVRTGALDNLARRRGGLVLRGERGGSKQQGGGENGKAGMSHARHPAINRPESKADGRCMLAKPALRG